MSSDPDSPAIQLHAAAYSICAAGPDVVYEM
jgi:hypothetical protein